MKFAKLQYQIKRGVIDSSDLEAEDVELLEQCLEDVRNERFDEAIAKLMPRMSLEWAWANCDASPEPICSEPTNFTIDLTEANTPQFQVGEHDGALVLTISVDFDLSVDDGVDLDTLSNWLSEHGASSCVLVSGGWTYSESDGEDLWVQSA